MEKVVDYFGDSVVLILYITAKFFEELTNTNSCNIVSYGFNFNGVLSSLNKANYLDKLKPKFFIARVAV